MTDPYYDLCEDWELVAASFQSMYGIRLPRQLRDMKSYMEQGTELYEQVQDMLPVADAVGGEETNSPIT
jgi:hypothetical protein